jgi:hypothetical protein
LVDLYLVAVSGWYLNRFIDDMDDPVSVGPLIELCQRGGGDEEERTAKEYNGTHIFV